MVAALLGACGSGDPPASSSADPQVSAAPTPDPTPGPTASPTGAPDAAAAPWSADGPSFGVDRTSWPDSMDAAQALLAALPEELDGQARELVPTEPDGGGGDLAGVFYGAEGLMVLVSDDTFPGESGAAPQVVGARTKLAALFGLSYGCDMDTYEGTIEPRGEFPVPGDTVVDAAAPAWFACRVDGAEGDDDFSGQAVGWTSADRVAWLAVGPDEATVRTLITAMQEADG